MQTCIGGATLVAKARIRYTALLQNTQIYNTIFKLPLRLEDTNILSIVLRRYI